MSATPGRGTLAVHAGLDGVRGTPAGMSTPIYQSSTFELTRAAYEDIRQTGGENTLWYTRLGNPTVSAAAAAVAALEGAEEAVLFSSGIAAISTALAEAVPPGGRIVAASALYGDTFEVLRLLADERGCEVALADVADLDDWTQALARPADAVYVESLSNPMLRVADLPAIAALAHAAGAILVVDSTFTSPVNVRPLQHGCDLVVHSATKYLNGHSDLIAGAVAGSKPLLGPLRRRAAVAGGCLDPHAAFLLARGLRTLALRMERHNENGLAVARWLEGNPEVEAVSYPLLDSHPDRKLADRLLDGGSGMVTLRVRGGDQRALRLLDELRLIRQATSLGGLESLASAPHNTSHLALSPIELEQVGILPGTIRLSLGVEDAFDLIADVDLALAASTEEPKPLEVPGDV